MEYWSIGVMEWWGDEDFRLKIAELGRHRAWGPARKGQSEKSGKGKTLRAQGISSALEV